MRKLKPSSSQAYRLIDAETAASPHDRLDAARIPFCPFDNGTQIREESSSRSKPMIVWIPIAVNEKPLLRGKIVIPEYSAAIIGSSVVLRVFGGGLTGLSYALTTIPFPTSEAAAEWIEANRFDMAYTGQLGEAQGS